jgi:hypothetical protein
MFHYVYRITNINERKHYIGVRSCHYLPILDLGIKYFSSSHDKVFLKTQKEFPFAFKYKILKTFDYRENAVLFEIKYHKKLDVAKNPKFYNKSIQTPSGFDMSGVKRNPFTLEHRKKMSLKKIGTEGNRKGKKTSQVTKEMISKGNTGKVRTDEFKLNVSKYHSGRKRSEETCKNISMALKGSTISEKRKLEISNEQYILQNRPWKSSNGKRNISIWKNLINIFFKWCDLNYCGKIHLSTKMGIKASYLGTCIKYFKTHGNPLFDLEYYLFIKGQYTNE